MTFILLVFAFVAQICSADFLICNSIAQYNNELNVTTFLNENHLVDPAHFGKDTPAAFHDVIPGYGEVFLEFHVMSGSNLNHDRYFKLTVTNEQNLTSTVQINSMFRRDVQLTMFVTDNGVIGSIPVKSYTTLSVGKVTVGDFSTPKGLEVLLTFNPFSVSILGDGDGPAGYLKGIQIIATSPFSNPSGYCIA